MGFGSRFFIILVCATGYVMVRTILLDGADDINVILFLDFCINVILFAAILAQVMENRMEIQASKHLSRSVNGMWGTCSICGEHYTVAEISLHRKGRCSPTTQQKNNQLFDKPESER